MNFILFIMFFITPPNNIKPEMKNTDTDQRVWTLQSTSSLDFNTMPQCENAKTNIAKRIEQTNTIKIRAWCIGKGVSQGIAPSEKSAVPDQEKSASPDLNEIRPLR